MFIFKRKTTIKGVEQKVEVNNGDVIGHLLKLSADLSKHTQGSLAFRKRTDKRLTKIEEKLEV